MAAATTAFAVRPARREDAPLILEFIRELARYEDRLDEVLATTAGLERWLFDENMAEAILGVENGTPVGFSVFHKTFSTYYGAPGLYMIDLFVTGEKRGLGYGTAILAYLAREVERRGYVKLEWSCLNWNRASAAFYLSLGATPLDGSTSYRLAGEELRDLAATAQP